MEVLAPAMPELVHHYGANVLAPGTTIHPDHFPAGMRVEPAPAMVGDVLLFSAYTTHRSTENRAGVMRWAADIRYHVPQAGDYYPHEWGFLGKSAREGDVVTDWREYVTKRSTHREERARLARETQRSFDDAKESVNDVIAKQNAALKRAWKPAAEETFLHPTTRHELEGELEFLGRHPNAAPARL